MAKVKNPSFWVALTLTPFVLIFGEMFPKNIGRVFQIKFVLYWLTPFRFFEFLLRPLVTVINFFPSKIVTLFFKDKKYILSKDDLKILTETLHSQGSIERLEKEAIVDALGFSQDRIKDVYLPFKKVVGIDYIDTQESILAKAQHHGFTRYPVFKNKEVVGYLNIFDLFYKECSDWHSLIRPIVKVGINQRLDDVLSLLRRKKENIALVFKGKGPCGIVSTQDLIREVISALTTS
jgi:putative hemolysin